MNGQKMLLVLVVLAVFMVAGCAPADTDTPEVEPAVPTATESPTPSLSPTETETPTETPSPTLTPTETETPTPSETPTATPIPPVYVTVETDGVYLREGPGSIYFTAGDAVKGDQLLVIGQAYDCEWLLVQKDDSLEGWVLADPVGFESPCEWFEAAEIPPTPFIPTITPTNPSGSSFLIINHTGKTLTLTFSGDYNYTFSVGTGKQHVKVFPGTYTIGISCGGPFQYIHGYVSSGWYLQIDTCP